jgi:hypothetical protein
VLHDTSSPDFSGSGEIPDIVSIVNMGTDTHICLTEYGSTQYPVSLLNGKQYWIVQMFYVLISVQVLIYNTLCPERCILQNVSGLIGKAVSPVYGVAPFCVYDLTRHCFSGAGHPPGADVI